MIAAGEDPTFVARRIVIAASEDVGNADPRGLSLAVAAMHATEVIGLPEAQYALGRLLETQERPDEAENCYRRATAAAPA